MRRLTYYVGMTLDGFIAAPDGSFDMFPVTRPVLDAICADYPETLPTHVRKALGVTATGTRFDTVVMGRGTYEPGLSAGFASPYAHLRQYVVSATLAPDAGAAVEVVADDPVDLVRRLKDEDGSGIWLAGGGRLAGALLDEIDDLVLKTYPLLLGRGIPVIAADHPQPMPFVLTDTRTLEGGTAIATFRRHRS